MLTYTNITTVHSFSLNWPESVFAQNLIFRFTHSSQKSAPAKITDNTVFGMDRVLEGTGLISVKIKRLQ